jgi:hypothetical protein
VAIAMSRDGHRDPQRIVLSNKDALAKLETMKRHMTQQNDKQREFWQKIAGDEELRTERDTKRATRVSRARELSVVKAWRACA